MMHTPTVFFFQAEDGIRDPLVTGVQTCALPISRRRRARGRRQPRPLTRRGRLRAHRTCRRHHAEIGRASCRERVEILVVAVSSKKKMSVYVSMVKLMDVLVDIR